MLEYDIALLKGIDGFFEKEFNTHSKLVKFKKGETLFVEDQLLKYFYFVVSGKIKSYQLNLDNAREQTIFIYRNGDMFDTIILLDSKPHDVMYEVLEEAALAQVPIEKVREWIDTNRVFNQKFFPYLASQMRYVEELATDLSLYDTSHRLIKLLLQSLDPANIQKYNLIHSLSNSEIAKLIGSVRQVVERHLKKLKLAGIIETNKKRIDIKQINRLLEKL
jgi:CRP-like cAMP-binding protein